MCYKLFYCTSKIVLLQKVTYQNSIQPILNHACCDKCLFTHTDRWYVVYVQLPLYLACICWCCYRGCHWLCWFHFPLQLPIYILGLHRCALYINVYTKPICMVKKTSLYFYHQAAENTSKYSVSSMRRAPVSHASPKKETSSKFIGYYLYN